MSTRRVQGMVRIMNAFIKNDSLDGTSSAEPTEAEGLHQMLLSAGYSDKSITYYLEKPYMGTIPNADINAEMTGSCGDTMGISMAIEENRITDARYQVLGCAGAVSAAMAVVDLIRGIRLDEAGELNDGDVFSLLEEIPEKKHHCIQLAVKTLHKALDEYSTRKEEG